MKGKSNKNLLVRLLNFLLISSTVISAVLLIMVLLAQYINPNSFVWFAFVALGAPVIFIVNLVLLLIWVLRWRVAALIVAVPLLFAAPSIGKFYQLPSEVEYHTEKSVKNYDLLMLSYNVHCFNRYQEGGSMLDSVLSRVQEVDPDILCMQEFYVSDSNKLHTVETMLSKYPYRAFQRGLNTSLIGYTGVATFSKFPIMDVDYRVFNTGSSNGYSIVDVALERDTMRLINCHLQTTSFNQVSKNRGLKELIKADSTEHITDKVMEALDRNFRTRAFQADTMKMLIDSSLYPVVLMGDFNSPPMTYTYRTVRGDLSDSFRDSGSGYGATFRPMKGLLRIDYLLYDSKKYQSTNYKTPQWEYSDHKPLIVKLKLKEK